MKRRLFENTGGNQFKLVSEDDFSNLDAQNPMHALAKRSPEETDMGSPEEKTEVRIGKEILNHIEQAHAENKDSSTQTMYIHLDEIARLAEELIRIHGQR
jgi:hypothetical protein